MATTYIGKPTSRVDGRAKVMGAATYAAEFRGDGLAYGYVVSSPIAKGRITRIDAERALALPGVLQVFTHENAPRLAWLDRNYRDELAPPGSPFRPLYDAEIKFSAQPVALVVAQTFELARFAASLVRVEYKESSHSTILEDVRDAAYEPRERSGIPQPPEPRGDADAAFASTPFKIEAEYLVPVEHHNPMELFGTTVIRHGDGKLTVYDKTQGVQNVQGYLCNVFGYSKGDLRVVSPYVGGAFGSGLRPQYQVFLAVLAARELERSMRLSLTRQQMFSLGHRPTAWQHVALAASPDGTLQSLIHDCISETSRYEDYSEPVVNWSSLLYKCNNVKSSYKVAQLDFCTPLDMRAPGAVWGAYAIECAMDELAIALHVDPLELRLKNYTEKDYNQGLPYSSKELRACYEQGAERFGWARRNPQPRSMRDGNSLVGWGMATGVWESSQEEATAKAVLSADSRLTVSSATADIGTGTYTIMTQIAAELLGLPMENVTFKLGDSSLSTSPVEGGSWTAATMGSAVNAVCNKVRHRLFKLAKKADDSPLSGASLDDAIFAEGCIRLRRDPSQCVSIRDAMRVGKLDRIEEEESAAPSRKQEKFGRYTHSAIFVELRVDEDFNTIYVTRVLNAVAAGRILNPKTARSQALGGIVWGIGMALEEESVIDPRFGRFMNHSMGDYHVPVNADVHNLEVVFVEEHDDVVNPLGIKGIGEIGVIGVAAAIANAVYHATGQRIRSLPITPDKLV